MGGLVRPPSAVRPSGHTPLDDLGMVQDESPAVCEQRLTSGLPKPDYGPVRQFDSVGYSLRHLCGDTA